MDKTAKIYVAGAQTLIGAGLARQLVRSGYANLVGLGEDEPDVTDRSEVMRFFESTRPEFVFMAAGKSGGIRANQKYPATLMLDNLLAECHVFEAAHRYQVEKMVYLASSCSYPRLAAQPMMVEALMTGPLEPTNLAYATSKLAGMILGQAYRQEYGDNFITAIPANAFGPGDDFDPENAHVISALITKMHDARRNSAEQVEIWGSGKPRREFIFVDDLADACIFVMNHYDESAPINLGGGIDLSIAELAGLIQQLTDYRGRLDFNASLPDGMPLKALDYRPLQQLGWQPATPITRALEITYAWFLEHSEEWET